MKKASSEKTEDYDCGCIGIPNGNHDAEQGAYQIISPESQTDELDDLFEDVFDSRYPKQVNYTLKKIGNLDDAQDLVLEAWKKTIQCYRTDPKYRINESSISGLSWRILKDEISNLNGRGRKRESKLIQEHDKEGIEGGFELFLSAEGRFEESAETTSADQQEQLRKQEQLRHLYTEIEKLPEEDEIIILGKFGGKSRSAIQKELQEKLGLYRSEKWISHQIARILKELQCNLNPGED